MGGLLMTETGQPGGGAGSGRVDLQARIDAVRAKAPAVRHTPPPQEAAERRAVDGIHRSAARTGDQWQHDATHVVKDYLATHPTMFVDDLWDLLPPLPEGQESGRGLGRVIQNASGYGWSEKVHPCPSCCAHGLKADDYWSRSSTSSNGTGKIVWKSKLWTPTQGEAA